VRALREIVDIILLFFGIIYAWVKLGNPGAQVGGGAGLFGGLATAFFFALSPVAVIAASVAGLIAGNLFVGGVYEWYRQQHEIDRQNQRVREYQEFMRQHFGQAVPRCTTCQLMLWVTSCWMWGMFPRNYSG
jgi:hypothetical protein